MEWSEFERLIASNPTYINVRMNLDECKPPWTPQYVIWNKGWGNRRANRRELVADWSRVQSMLDELVGNRWFAVGYSIILFENKSDAMLAKLGWPVELL